MILRRILALFLLLSLVDTAAFAQPTGLNIAGGDTLVVSGSVTRDNCKISAVDGTAFVDFTAANVLTDRNGYRLVLKDSTGKMISGIIGDDGTGETLDVEKISNGSFTSWTGDNPGNWNIVNEDANNYVTESPVGVARFISNNTSAVSIFQSNVTIPELVLIKLTCDVNIISGGWRYRVNYFGMDYINSTVSGAFSMYGTKTGTNSLYFYRYSVGSSEYTLDNVSLKKVLTPSATGATIISTKGGSTQNWSAKNAAFNYNDASGYTYQIYRINSNPVVASGTATFANSHLSFYAGQAFVDLALDWSAYRNGQYQLVLYDTSGVQAAMAFIKSGAPGGEALGAEIATGTLTANKLYKITATEVDHFFTGCAIDGYFTSDGTETCDANNKVKEVTDCPATAVYLVSTLGGSTRNMNYIETGFGVKDLTGFTWKIYYVGT